MKPTSNRFFICVKGNRRVRRWNYFRIKPENFYPRKTIEEGTPFPESSTISINPKIIPNRSKKNQEKGKAKDKKIAINLSKS